MATGQPPTTTAPGEAPELCATPPACAPLPGGGAPILIEEERAGPPPEQPPPEQLARIDALARAAEGQRTAQSHANCPFCSVTVRGGKLQRHLYNTHLRVRAPDDIKARLPLWEGRKPEIASHILAMPGPDVFGEDAWVRECFARLQPRGPIPALRTPPSVTAAMSTIVAHLAAAASLGTGSQRTPNSQEAALVAQLAAAAAAAAARNPLAVEADRAAAADSLPTAMVSTTASSTSALPSPSLAASAPVGAASTTAATTAASTAASATSTTATITTTTSSDSASSPPISDATAAATAATAATTTTTTSTGTTAPSHLGKQPRHASPETERPPAKRLNAHDAAMAVAIVYRLPSLAQIRQTLLDSGMSELGADDARIYRLYQHGPLRIAACCTCKLVKRRVHLLFVEAAPVSRERMHALHDVVGRFRPQVVALLMQPLVAAAAAAPAAAPMPSTTGSSYMTSGVAAMPMPMPMPPLLVEQPSDTDVVTIRVLGNADQLAKHQLVVADRGFGYSPYYYGLQLRLLPPATADEADPDHPLLPFATFLEWKWRQEHNVASTSTTSSSSTAAATAAFQVCLRLSGGRRFEDRMTALVAFLDTMPLDDGESAASWLAGDYAEQLRSNDIVELAAALGLKLVISSE